MTTTSSCWIRTKYKIKYRKHTEKKINDLSFVLFLNDIINYLLYFNIFLSSIISIHLNNSLAIFFVFFHNYFLFILEYVLKRREKYTKTKPIWKVSKEQRKFLLYYIIRKIIQAKLGYLLKINVKRNLKWNWYDK